MKLDKRVTSIMRDLVKIKFQEDLTRKVDFCMLDRTHLQIKSMLKMMFLGKRRKKQCSKEGL